MTSIFSVAEARAFIVGDRTPLSNATTYPDEAIQAAADGITAEFERICGVSFVPATVTDEVLAGTGDHTLILPRTRVTAVAALARRWPGATDWTALTSDELAATVVDEAGTVTWHWGRWPHGAGRVRATYTHGYATPPYRIKHAALILCWRWLAGENLGDRVLSMTNATGGVERFAVAGGNGGRWHFGYPEVDAALNDYSERIGRVG